MNRQERRATKKMMVLENKKHSDRLEMVARCEWPYEQPGMFGLFRSKKYLVQVFHEKSDIIRLSVCRTDINNQGQWLDNISWEDLQEIKNQCGFGQNEAVEIYPPEKDVVNVANMRHLWVLPASLGFSWKKNGEAA